MTTHLSFEAKKILSHGLSLVGFGKKWQKCQEALSIRRFQAHYDIVSDLKEKYHMPINLPNLFIALYRLKLYGTKEVIAGQ